MSVSLVYDGTLSRVRINGTGLTVSDSFTRSVSSGWGTSDITGHVWSTSGGAASDYSTTGTRGRHLLASVAASRNTFTGSDIADVDITVDVVIPQLATGGAIRGGILARRVDGSNYYWAQLDCETDQVVTVSLFRVVGGSSTTLGTAVIPGEVHTTSDTFSMQFQLVGTTLRVKAFGSAPDPGWLVDVTDSALTSGAVGARSILETGNTNVSPVVEYDNFLAIPTLTVERTTGPYDDFTRSVSSGWGTATTGHAWATSGGSASDYSVTGSKGRMAVGTVTLTRNAVLGSMWDDSDVTVDTIAPVLATGARINVAVLARWQDADNQYSLNASYRTDGTVDLFFLTRVAGVETELDRATGVLTYVPGVSYRMRFQVAGNTLRGKMWAGVEPATWAVEGTANDLPAGGIGLRAWITNGNTNVSPVNLDFDNFTVPWTTVRGGASLTPSGGAVAVDDYEFTPDVSNTYRLLGQTGAIIPTLNGVWLKSISNPALNRQVKVRDWSTVRRRGRSSLFDVVGAKMPVAVSEVRGSRQWTIDVRAADPAEAALINRLLDDGGVILVHVPAASTIPGGYVIVGDSEEAHSGSLLARRIISLPLTEVAAPPATVTGVSVP